MTGSSVRARAAFLIFIFIGFFGFDFLTASASAKAINFATNLAAFITFAAAGQVLYEYAVPMGVCNVAGASSAHGWPCSKATGSCDCSS